MTACTEATEQVKESSEQVKERCKERMDNYRRDVKKDMPLSDQLDMRAP